MSLRLAATSMLAAFLACGGDGGTLTVNPSGTVQATGPVVLTAGPASLRQTVNWSLAGPGAISTASGATTTYTPPRVVDISQTATVTATAGGKKIDVILALAPAAIAAPPIASLTDAVEVTYDAQQIPHVFCKVAEDCFAVQGYLQAQDRLFQMDLFRRTARGRLAELIGTLQLSSDQTFLALFATRDGKRIEDQLVAALDAGTRAKMDAFAAGVNAFLGFLTAHPTLMPLEYAQLGVPLTPADIPAWTAQDTLAIGRLQQFQLSETLGKELDAGAFASVYAPGGLKSDPAKYAAYFRSKQPIADYTLSPTDLRSQGPASARAGPGAAVPSVEGQAPWRDGLARVSAAVDGLRPLFGSLRAGAGSNNWAVDAAHSATGKALLANDPHLSLQYPPLFHLASLTAGDGSSLNLAGASFPGIPGALIGRGAHLAWGVTVVGYDVTDVYLEKLSGCTGPAALPCTSVSFKGADVPLVPVQYQVNVRTSSGLVKQPVTVLIVPHHGPVLDYDPVNKTAISFRWTGHEVTNDLRAFLGLNVATAVGDKSAPAAGTAFAALKDYAVGAQNFVLADDQGNIGYDPHAIVPKRPWAGTGRGKLPWLPLAGDTGTAEWGSGTAGDNCAGTVTGGNLPAAACWVPDDQLPREVNPAKGYLATANSDPAGYGANNDPALNPGVAGAPYLSFDWDEPTGVRYGRIAELLKAKTAGGGKLTIDDMLAIQNDHSVKVASLYRPFAPAVTDVPAGQQTAYSAALATWNQWATDGYDCPTGLTGPDPTSAVDTDPKRARSSAACLLFHAFVTQLHHAVFDDDFALIGALTGHGVSPELHTDTRSMLYLLSLPANHPGASFCNDVDRTGEVVASRSCTEQFVNALAGAQTALTTSLGATSNWIWGRVHTLTTSSPASPLVGASFQAGPFARPGGFLTVDVGNPRRSQPALKFAYDHGSNLRLVAVMNDAASAVVKMQLPGPQKDAPYGSLTGAPDLLRQYVQNIPFDYTLGHQVDTAVVGGQHFGKQ